jgi:hypothetical protein
MVNRVGWGRNLDTFNDILLGDFGTPYESYVLTWMNSEWSREMLEFGETVLFLDEMWQRFNLGLGYPEFLQRDHERLAQYLEDEKLVKQEVERYQEEYHDLENRLASAKLNEGGTVSNWNVVTLKRRTQLS